MPLTRAHAHALLPVGCADGVQEPPAEGVAFPSKGPELCKVRTLDAGVEGRPQAGPLALLRCARRRPIGVPKYTYANEQEGGVNREASDRVSAYNNWCCPAREEFKFKCTVLLQALS